MTKNTALWIVVAAMIVAIIPIMPYGYYSLMRWVACPVLAWLAILSYRSGADNWMWVWGISAGIYNPILPVHATREFWTVVNLVTIGFVVWYRLNTSGDTRAPNDER